MGHAAPIAIYDYRYVRQPVYQFKTMEIASMSTEINVEPMCKSSIGKELTVAECRILGGVMGIKHLKDGELLSKEGDAVNTLFILIEGKLDLFNDKEGKGPVLYTMHKGECAGTRAFIDRTTRKATLVAKGDTTVYTLEPEAFETLIDDNPRIIYKVMSALFRNTHTNLIRMNKEAEQLSNYINKTQGKY
jgi:signal-transduction protein with cAMP-binding, CBS, and nucleotidyltransferase domain